LLIKLVVWRENINKYHGKKYKKDAPKPTSNQIKKFSIVEKPQINTQSVAPINDLIHK